jgi:hypothetical protein
MTKLTSSAIANLVYPNSVRPGQHSYSLDSITGKLALLFLDMDTFHDWLASRHIYLDKRGRVAGTFTALSNRCKENLSSGDRILVIQTTKGPKTNNRAVPTGKVYEMEYIGSSDAGEPTFKIHGERTVI